MTKNRQWLATLLALALVLVTVFSCVYIALEADHDCSGDDCVICQQIVSCQQLLKAVGLTGAVFAAGICRHFARALVMVLVSEMVAAFTLVSSKVKLSN
ncbi:MAG: hypothetical protein Q4C56_03900 [Peptococcaceae bacterium]|nr:hypothetical protein [Peptococcaceae bacterium]